MVRTRSTARKGRPSKSKGAKRFKAAPPSPKLKKKVPKLPVGIASDSLRHIVAAEAHLKRCEDEWEKAKKVAREYKAKKEQAREELHRIIQEEGGNDPGLFAGPTRAAMASMNGTGHAPAIVEDEAWRDVPLKHINIPKGICETLHSEANIDTLGELTDYTDPNKNGGRQNRLDQIKGLGAGKIQRIEEATTAYWADRKKASEQRREEASKVVEDVAASTAVNQAAFDDAGDEQAEEDDVDGEDLGQGEA